MTDQGLCRHCQDALGRGAEYTHGRRSRIAESLPNTWYGVWAPAGTPHDIITKINRAVVAALTDSNVHKRFAYMGLEVPPAEQQTPEALEMLQRAEIEKWWPIIKASGIKAE